MLGLRSSVHSCSPESSLARKLNEKIIKQKSFLCAWWTKPKKGAVAAATPPFLRACAHQRTYMRARLHTHTQHGHTLQEIPASSVFASGPHQVLFSVALADVYHDDFGFAADFSKVEGLPVCCHLTCAIFKSVWEVSWLFQMCSRSFHASPGHPQPVGARLLYALGMLAMEHRNISSLEEKFVLMQRYSWSSP